MAILAGLSVNMIPGGNLKTCFKSPCSLFSKKANRIGAWGRDNEARVVTVFRGITGSLGVGVVVIAWGGGG